MHSGKLNTICRKLAIGVRQFSSNATTNVPSFEHLSVTFPKPFVAQVTLNRPDRRNALNARLWTEIGECFGHLAENADCRSIVLSGAGKSFCSGIDLEDMSHLMQIIISDQLDSARKAFKIRAVIKKYQSSFTAVEKCMKPVIAAIHGNCLGGAIGLITAADIRYAATDCDFQIKEVDLGLAADVGQLQRLSKIIGNHSTLRELCFSSKIFSAEEALRIGLISRLFESSKSTLDASIELASLLAQKSPVAIQGTKEQLNFSRDHSVDESLYAMANWNMVMLQSEDLLNAASAIVSKQSDPVDFAKL